MDVVYLIRPGEKNPELRYSLRSLINVPHDHVWFVGHRPSWVQSVKHLSGNPSTQTAVNVFRNLQIACEADELSDDIIVMNDDFHVLGPWTHRRLYRCTLQEHLRILRGRTDPWTRSLRVTKQWFRQRGMQSPLSYELHRPVTINRAQMGDLLAEIADFGHPTPPQWRTLYGNTYWRGASRHPDYKVHHWGDDLDRVDVISTDDRSWPHIEPHVAARFLQPSPYEVT